MKTSLPALRALLASALAVLALGLAVRAGLLSAQAAARPNILSIMVDEMRWANRAAKSINFYQLVRIVAARKLQRGEAAPDLDGDIQPSMELT